MKIRILFFMIIALLLSAAVTPFIFAADGWEANLMISASEFGQKLSFGARPDATDGIDGQYDVPPMNGGTMTAYFTSGGKLWRDIRAFSHQTKKWNLHIESSAAGKDVILSWDCQQLPADEDVLLYDSVENATVDMKKHTQYEYKNTGPRDIKIVVR